jgi:hypothetical protein
MPSCFVLAAGNAPLIRIGSLDIDIIAIYFAVVLGIGIYLSTRGDPPRHPLFERNQGR